MGTNQKKHRRLISQSIILLLGCVALYFAYSEYVEKLDAAGKIEGRFELSPGKFTPYFSFEIADTPGERAKGLMFRRSGEMRTDQGMIFVFPDVDVRSFWMRNTFISLDMIFLDEGLKVLGVLSNVPPLTEDPRTVNKPGKYVVEFLAGVAAKSGIGEGAKLEFKGELPHPR